MAEPSRLLERDRSCLVVIDVQQHFLDKLPLDRREPLAQRIAWLIRVAAALEIPVVAMAEDLPKVGPPVDAVRDALPPGTRVYDKRVFGLAGQPEILAAVRATGRRDLVLLGLETDVCVAHSALGLLDQGWRVAVAEDATGSPPPHHAAGLARMAAAGVLVTTVKGVYYEWVRDLATNAEVRRRLQGPLPAGLTL
jgi:nicotinamidase-related amidase